MKKTYQNPNTEISWWVGDNLCGGNLGGQYLLGDPSQPGGKTPPTGHVTGGGGSAQ